MYRSVFSIFFLLLWCTGSYAFEFRVTPEEIRPGDIFLLTIQSGHPETVEAEFLKKNILFSRSGTDELIALVPVDVNTRPGKYTISVHDQENKQSASVTVKPYAFKSIKLTLPKGKVTLSPESQKRVEKEYILQKNIWKKKTDRAWQGQFVVPLDTEVSTEFGVKRIMNEKKTSVHRGMDFRGKTGTPVKAVNEGTVVLSADLFYGGNTLVVDHGMGLYSVYMHLSGFNVAHGNKVEKGQIVAFVGSSGRATGPHLHLSIKLDGTSVNPDSLFKLQL